MMYLRSLVWVVVVSIAVTSCQNKPAGEVKNNSIATDTLLYNNKSVSKSTGPCKAPDDVCAKVEFSYPLFETNGDSLNKWVAQKLGEGYTDTVIHENYEVVMQQYLNGYEKMLKAMPNYITPWEYKRSITVDKQTPGYVSFHLHVYDLSGDGNPEVKDAYFHYDVKNNEEFRLDDLLVSGGETKLATIAEHVFRKEFKLREGVSLDSSGFFFDNGQFSLPVNYTFAQDGIRFHYNGYEIPSHEAAYDLTVPYSEIKELAKPGGYLASLIPAVQ
ncbi:MAG: hypothetical protein JWO03_1843 [Bacteroidetes bacterium]|nr:hypothetical protein [Bacteroidota bacterium]